ncbi:hypothetical protein MJ904_10280 [Massilia sp. MB5]|uniref:hypothetical protein n=1 Tax=Massilia sp. MB5 TaxID=2919578 RepID=UPI001F0D51EF|nr:hypothetical protein [Massilia sp. MB5]UMR32527.1 hypothetical protein MJ904_10280 [Massilia sp. MB5]
MMLIRSFLLPPLTLTMASACAVPGSASIEWIRTEVVPGEGPVNAALFVPIELNGMECQAQLEIP